MSDNRAHVSVLLRPVIDSLSPRPNGRYIDGTVGAGGHAAAIAEASAPTGRLLGLDADPHALKVAASTLERYADRVVLRNLNFEKIAAAARENGFVPADGILLDLGLSSMQLFDSTRGFSFQTAGALDMRFDPTGPVTAAELVNSLVENELADLIFKYGEEHASRRIARAIVNARPIETAQQLARIIESATGRHSRIHPATRTFQALRIAVNRELDVLETVLPEIAGILAPQGRVAIITFHSLEDRIVKNFFRNATELRVLTKHPVRPTREEVLANPRSRSAKLRVAERIG